MTALTDQKMVIATCLISLGSIVVMPDVLLGVFFEVIHLMLELAHVLFELLESSLDHLVEHIFHTETRETQVIVFYIIIGMGLVSLYFLYRTVLVFLSSLKERIQSALFEYKYKVIRYWAESTGNKFQVIAWSHVTLTLVYLFAF